MSSNQEINKTLRRIRAQNKFIQNFTSTKDKFNIEDCHILTKGLLIRQFSPHHSQIKRTVKTAKLARSKTINNKQVSKILDHSSSHQLYVGNCESPCLLQQKKLSIVNQKSSPAWCRQHIKINCLKSQKKQQDKNYEHKQKIIMKNNTNFVFDIRMEAYEQKQLRVGNKKSLDKKEILKGAQKKIKNSKHWSQVKKDLQELKNNKNSPFPFLISPEKFPKDIQKVCTKTIDGFHAIRKIRPIIKLQHSLQKQQENTKLSNFRQLIQGSIGSIQISCKTNTSQQMHKQIRTYSSNPSVMSYKQKKISASKQINSPTKICAWQAKQFAWMDVSQSLIQ